ncbi:MAG: nucleotidyltransferase family protein [Bacteroidales bacterium]|nr:nucleotidyltransferase family protein [Bacteroidales bacterium]
MRKRFVQNYKSTEFQLLDSLFSLFREYNDLEISRLLSELIENRISQLYLKKHASPLQGNPEISATLNQVKNEILFNNLYYLNHLKKILTVFAEKKIEVVVLKGVSLISHLYKDASLRTFVDLDFLVRKEDKYRFTDTLQEMGYRPDYGSKDIHTTKQFTAYNPATRVNIDILLQLDADPYPNRYFPIDQNLIWARKEKISFDGIEAYRLSLEDELVYHIYHLAFHLYFEIEVKWVFDLYFYLEKYGSELDSDYLKERFQSLGFQHLLRIISDLLFWAFHEEYPALLAASAEESNPLQRAWLTYYSYPPRLFAKIKSRRNLASRMSATMIKLALPYGSTRKWKFILDRLLPQKSRLGFAFRKQIVLKDKFFYIVIQSSFFLLFPVFFTVGALYYLGLTGTIGIRLQRWRYFG